MSSNTDFPLRPGAMLGVLGGGQLGRMFASEALRMGYQVTVLDPDPVSPTGAIATEHIQAAYDDSEALLQMATSCAAVTTEFENIPAGSIRYLAQHTRVAPDADCIEIAQDRRAEKQFVSRHGLNCAPYAIIESVGDLQAAASAVGFPSILKTARLGYDGKGQHVCENEASLAVAFDAVRQVPCVLEQRVDLALEVSAVLARGDNGEVRVFPVAENRHRNGILDVTLVPAALDSRTEQRAVDMATELARALGYVGVLAVEMFVTGEGALLINEIAPRPHNSGHFTLDATVTSQFEQQVRTLCGLPPGDTRLLSPVGMLNLLGDRWQPTPDWRRVDDYPGAKLHLYGKAEARPGRKMGHINLLAASLEQVGSELAQLDRLL